MDEEEEYEAGFEPGTNILVTSEGGLEAGVLLAHNPYGVWFKKTHRLGVIGLSTDKDKAVIRRSLMNCNTMQLRRLAKQGGLGLFEVVRAKRDELLEVCFDQWVEDRDSAGAVEALIPLSVPTTAWLPEHMVDRVESLEDFTMDLELGRLDFDADEGVVSEDETY